MGSQVSISSAAATASNAAEMAVQQNIADANARAARNETPKGPQSFENMIRQELQRDNLEPRGNVAIIRRFPEKTPFERKF